MRFRKIAGWVGLASMLGASAIVAQTGGPTLLRDIATPPDPFATYLIFGPLHFASLGGVSYYSAWDANRGLELWRTDGTPAGTHVVRDICPGSCNGRIWPELVVSGGMLFFAAEDAAHGVELWRSDGTAAGTVMVKDVKTGLRPSYPTFLTPAMNGVFFVADDGVAGYELWWSDGSEAGTHLVADVLPGDPLSPLTGQDAGPTHLAMLDATTLLFAANDGVHGRELWRSDGSPGGTTLVKDVIPGAADGLQLYQAYPLTWSGPAVAGGHYFFAGGVGGGSYDEAPWVSDGTEAGTLALVSAAPFDGWRLHSLFRFDDLVLFAGGTSGPGVTLWRSDGTMGGTYPLGNAGNGGQELRPVAFARLGDEVYFPGSQDATGRELWVTDGTTAGTHLVADVIPGATGGLGWTFTGLAGGGSRMFFPADDGTHGIELWSSDGTAAGTAMVADFQPGSAGSIQPLELPVLPASSGGHLLWRSLEPEGWVVRSLDLQSDTVEALQRTGDRPSSVPHCVFLGCPTAVATGEGFAFAGTDPAHGAEPWLTDGTPAGTVSLGDPLPGPQGSLEMGLRPALASLPGALLLLLREPDPAQRFQVWSTHGGTLAQITNQTANSGPNSIAAWNGAGYFTTPAGLWRTDGTAAATSALVGDGECWSPTPAVDDLFFVRDYRLWATGGTVGSTRKVAPSLDPEIGYTLESASAQAADRFYFFAADASAGRELWLTDGTDGGTYRVVDLRAGAGDSIADFFDASENSPPPKLATLGDLALFAADDGGGGGEELWVSDGSAGNATMLEIRPGPAGSQPRWLTRLGTVVYFVADDGVHGRELWVSDGSVAGTHLVSDVLVGPGSSTPRELVEWAGRLAFAADDGVHGMELWKVAAGSPTAELLVDLWPGIDPASPQGLTASGEILLFFADDGVHGLEPWAWSVGASMFADGFETGNTDRWSGGRVP